MAIEIVDFPMKNGDFPVRYVSLPEGICLWDFCGQFSTSISLINGPLQVAHVRVVQKRAPVLRDPRPILINPEFMWGKFRDPLDGWMDGWMDGCLFECTNV